MNTLKAFFVFFPVALFSIGANAVAGSTTCSDSYGEVSVVDGRVTIKDGIGDVGLAKTQRVIAEISEKCNDGAFSKLTVQAVTFEIEENVERNSVVLCTHVMSACK